VIAEEDIAHSPAWLPLEVDATAVKLLCLNEAAYRAASFLDQRILSLGYEQQACTVATLQAAAARLARRAQYVFHIGHVGSTLISRLIGEHPQLFSLREPALLRTIAAGYSEGSGVPDLSLALALFSRTWRPCQRAVIKVTSFVSELAETILAGAERPAAIFVFAQPLPYLQGILAGPNSRVETRQLAPARLQRLARRLMQSGWRPEVRSEGEYIAMSWLCEMTALQQAARRVGRQVLWVDFDVFLAGPVAALEAILRTLGVSAAAAEIEALVTGPLMRQYSKAPEYAYDASLRRQVLESADREHHTEISRGMDWLQKAAVHDPLMQEALG
jgi:hypothetical protein